MKVSVVVVTYEAHYQYLPQALASIDYTEAEIILVNNSNEGTTLGPIPNVKIINLPKPVQVGAARNLGVLVTTSDIIVFLDSDDWFIPNAIDRMVYEYKQEEVPTIIFGDVIKGLDNSVYQPKDYGTINNKDLKATPLRTANRPYCCLIPKAYHLQYPFDENLASWEDLVYEIDHWLARLPSRKIDAVIYYYRWNNAGRRAIMDVNSDVYNKAIWNEVQGFIDERYSPYLKGEIQMPCGTCGQKPRKIISNSTDANAVRRSLEIESDEIAYLEYVGDEVSRSVTGPITKLSYNFGRSPQRKKRKLIVTKPKDAVNTVYEVHIQDVSGLSSINMQGFNLFMVRKEVIVKQAAPSMTTKIETVAVPVAPVTIEEPVETVISFSQPTPVSDFTIKGMEAELKTGVDAATVEYWLLAEKDSERPRKGMIDLLETTLDAVPS